ncbi:MAG: SRPBCC family protein [Acidobacteria bacterium]|nr:SRPBCC family protein [Acidobacteriota bacterium]
MNEQSVSEQRVIAADAADIFAVIADANRHSEFDGSGTVKGTASITEPLALGSKFRMKMRLGLPYRITSTVVEFELDRLIAWQHPGKHTWRYELEPMDDATLVTETFDWSTSRSPKLIELFRFPKSHPSKMAQTLERLESVVTD